MGTETARDLTTGALAINHENWKNQTDYSTCHDLTKTAREDDFIRLQSVHDPDNGANLTVLTCGAFWDAAPDRQSWRIRISPFGTQAVGDHPRLGLEYGRDTFDFDQKVDWLAWKR